jgi:hypothetical protein
VTRVLVLKRKRYGKMGASIQLAIDEVFLTGGANR